MGGESVVDEDPNHEPIGFCEPKDVVAAFVVRFDDSITVQTVTRTILPPRSARMKQRVGPV